MVNKLNKLIFDKIMSIIYLGPRHPHRCSPLQTGWGDQAGVSCWGPWLALLLCPSGNPISQGVLMRSQLQTTDQSLAPPKGEEASICGSGSRWPFSSLNSCSWHCKNIINVLTNKLTRPFVSRNLGNTVSTVLHCSGSWINFCLCWKVSLIFKKICSLSVVCFSRDMASRHWSPSNCCTLVTSLSKFGPLLFVVWELLLLPPLVPPLLSSRCVFLIFQAM